MGARVVDAGVGVLKFHGVARHAALPELLARWVVSERIGADEATRLAVGQPIPRVSPVVDQVVGRGQPCGAGASAAVSAAEIIWCERYPVFVGPTSLPQQPRGDTGVTTELATATVPL
jgi:hypothetical protein